MLKSDPRARLGVAELEELEDRLEKLKHAYDLFFAGIEHIDPTDKKAPIRQLVSRLNEMSLRNPAVRFKFQTLVGRFVSMNQYWTRIMREIEEGRISRTLFRDRIIKPEKPKAFFGKEAPNLDPGGVKRIEEAAATAPVPYLEKGRHDGAPMIELTEIDLGKFDPSSVPPPETKKAPPSSSPPAAPDLPSLASKPSSRPPDVPDLPSLASAPLSRPPEAGASAPADRPPARPAPPAPPVAPKPAAPVKPAAAHAASLDDTAINRIYSELVEARRKVNDPAGIPTREDLKNQILKQARLVREKHGGEAVDFKVVTKDGKVVLRPLVKKPAP